MIKVAVEQEADKNRHLFQGIGQQKLCEIQKTIAIKCTQYFLIETVKCYPSLEICSGKLIKKHSQWKESINVMGEAWTHIGFPITFTVSRLIAHYTVKM
ncbi:hypothetical protein GY31_18065 [Lysinibacillus sphaericus]|uniref:hypothetical protein n=1 Tax=Lysinibacillus TaxID=400634 RepID=UPI00084B1467|nr:hypothetical protein [Lysinibacillus sphaericus]OEC00727.1 hypothetical protein GY31_18065 [Lysinibacillus sphaericus]